MQEPLVLDTSLIFGLSGFNFGALRCARTDTLTDVLAEKRKTEESRSPPTVQPDLS